VLLLRACFDNSPSLFFSIKSNWVKYVCVHICRYISTGFVIPAVVFIKNAPVSTKHLFISYIAKKSLSDLSIFMIDFA